MDILQRQNIIPIENKEANLLVTDQVSLESSVFATNKLDVVINVYDTFGNFLFKEKIEGKDFTFDYRNEEEYIEDVKNLIREKELNENGKYRLEYYFVDDIFDSIENDDNTFIITEISADRTEVRLNPKSNNEKLLQKFNDFKNYITGYETITVVELFIEESITEYLNYYFTRISEFIEEVKVKNEDGSNPRPLRTYLNLFYDTDVINTIINNMVNDILDKKDIIHSTIKNEINSNENLESLIVEYEADPTNTKLSQIQDFVFNILTNRLPIVIINEASIEISQE